MQPRDIALHPMLELLSRIPDTALCAVTQDDATDDLCGSSIEENLDTGVRVRRAPRPGRSYRQAQEVQEATMELRAGWQGRSGAVTT